jgi:AraC-like DNA-binding protein
MIVNDIALIIASLGLVQGVLLSIYLLTRKAGNKKANIFLAIVILGVTLRVARSVIGYYVPLVSWQRNIGISGALLAGPFLWFYGFTILDKARLNARLNYPHLSPFMVFVLLLFAIPSDGKFANFWNYGIVVAHLFIYLLLSWILLFKNHDNASKIACNWYRNILIGITVVWLHYLTNLLKITPVYIAGPVFYAFLSYALTYLFLNRQNFGEEKYKSSKLERSTSEDLFQRLIVLFRETSLYNDPDINIRKVAEKLSTSPRILSQVINENSKRNFSEYINQYRIESARSKLRDPKYAGDKIATIAFDAGFGTVTSFNIAFKKQTGFTPSEYRKNHLTH